MEHDGKVGCNAVEYTTAFLYSDWLYFLRNGIHEYIYEERLVCTIRKHR